MKTLKVIPNEHDDTLNSIYENSSTSLAFAVCSPEKDGTVEQVSSFYYCREAIMSLMPELISSDKFSSKNIWLLMYKGVSNNRKKYIADFENHISNGITLVNHYERRNKWLLSKAYKGSHKQEETRPVYVIKGSRWWLTAPHTFSLYMLLLRISEQKQFNNINRDSTTEKIMECIKKISSDSYDHTKTRTPELWNVLLDKRRKIYGNRTVKNTFDIVKSHGGHEGILTLTKGSCSDKETFKIFKELCQEAGVWK